jgi:hypothetical protein
MSTVRQSKPAPHQQADRVELSLAAQQWFSVE